MDLYCSIGLDYVCAFSADLICGCSVTDVPDANAKQSLQPMAMCNRETKFKLTLEASALDNGQYLNSAFGQLKGIVRNLQQGTPVPLRQGEAYLDFIKKRHRFVTDMFMDFINRTVVQQSYSPLTSLYMTQTVYVKGIVADKKSDSPWSCRTDSYFYVWCPTLDDPDPWNIPAPHSVHELRVDKAICNCRNFLIDTTNGEKSPEHFKFGV